MLINRLIQIQFQKNTYEEIRISIKENKTGKTVQSKQRNTFLSDENNKKIDYSSRIVMDASDVRWTYFGILHTRPLLLHDKMQLSSNISLQWTSTSFAG